MAITLEALKQMVGDKDFEIVFKKRTNNEIRTMSARFKKKEIDETVPLAERSIPVIDPEKHGLVVLWDIEKKGYRSVPLDGVVIVKVSGKIYNLRN